MYLVGYPVLPLIQQLHNQTSAHAAGYIHWGATTQDIMDSASVLQIKDGLGIIRSQLVELVSILRKLIDKHRDTVMAGRTHLQHALPCTFGYKCAVYLAGMMRHLERLEQLEPRCLHVQFGGAAGTLASLGSDDLGIRVRAALAEELGLREPPITWHSTRDSIAEVLNFLALVGGSLGKIAYDVMIMSSNEMGEVAEPFVPHRGASSTMPQKRNPISSEIVFAAAKILRSSASLGLDAMMVDFERASGPWHLEWLAVPEAFLVASGSLHHAIFALNGLSVNTGAMERNLLSTKGLIVGEAAMMALASCIGRQAAHDVVYDACRESIESGKTLYQCLSSRAQVTDNIDAKRLEAICDPRNYLGASQIMADAVLRWSEHYG